MKFNQRNIILFTISILLIIAYYNYKKYLLEEETYSCEIKGKIESIRNIGRGEGYLQFRLDNEDRFRPTKVIYLGNNDKNDIKKGDSIDKRINSYRFKLFKIDSSGHFNYYKTYTFKP